MKRPGTGTRGMVTEEGEEEYRCRSYVKGEERREWGTIPPPRERVSHQVVVHSIEYRKQ